MSHSPAPIFASPDNLRIIGTMIGTSYRSPMTLDQIVPCIQHVDRTRPPKLPETSWLYGTPYWDQLTDTQRLEVLWLETARDVSNFITLEQFLPPMFMGYLSAFGAALAPEIEEYMTIFSKEEIVHTMMFRRYMEAAKLPAFFLPRRSGYAPVMDMLEFSPHTTPPVLGIFWTLLLEWTAELNAMHGTQDNSVDPATRHMFRAHHIDEVRHLAFGKRIVEDFYASCSREDWARMRALLQPAIQDVFAEFRFTEQICELASFAFPFAAGDLAAIQSVRDSANNARLHRERFQEVEDWLTKLELI